MNTTPRKPTVRETSRTEREQMVARHTAGESYQQIADALGWCRTVIRWVTRAEREGPVALGDRSRRPHRSPPATLAPAVVARSDAIRRAHPGWGPRLIRHQLEPAGTPAPAGGPHLGVGVDRSGRDAGRAPLADRLQGEASPRHPG